MVREHRRRLHRGAITGLLTAIIFTLLGGWPFTFDIVGGALTPAPNGLEGLGGLLMLIFGIVSVGSDLGLFQGAPYHGQAWIGWIAMRADREEKERKKEVESD